MMEEGNLGETDSGPGAVTREAVREAKDFAWPHRNGNEYLLDAKEERAALNRAEEIHRTLTVAVTAWFCRNECDLIGAPVMPENWAKVQAEIDVLERGIAESLAVLKKKGE